MSSIFVLTLETNWKRFLKFDKIISSLEELMPHKQKKNFVFLCPFFACFRSSNSVMHIFRHIFINYNSYINDENQVSNLSNQFLIFSCMRLVTTICKWFWKTFRYSQHFLVLHRDEYFQFLNAKKILGSILDWLSLITFLFEKNKNNVWLNKNFGFSDFRKSIFNKIPTNVRLCVIFTTYCHYYLL